jgi:hypothetical protein
MVVKYIINNEVLTDRKSMCNEFDMSRTRLHNSLSGISPSINYWGVFLYNYDEIHNHLKKNKMISETSD